jgi:hypothetical protein
MGRLCWNSTLRAVKKIIIEFWLDFFGGPFPLILFSRFLNCITLLLDHLTHHPSPAPAPAPEILITYNDVGE